jgi:hypothetical protein
MNFLVVCKRGRFGFKVKISFGIHVYHNEFLLRFAKDLDCLLTPWHLKMQNLHFALFINLILQSVPCTKFDGL